jgi:hypothetical protein
MFLYMQQKFDGPDRLLIATMYIYLMHINYKVILEIHLISHKE